MRSPFFFVGLMLAGLPLQAQVAKPIRWACIGNSITAGYPDANLTYTTRLANLLGPQFTVQNHGVSGATLMKKGDNPYWNQAAFKNVFTFKPDIITIKLGTNDTKSGNWKFEADFVKDLAAMVDSLATMPSHPQIGLCLPCPIFANPFGINDSILTQFIIPRIQQVAQAKGLNLIDVNTPLRNRSNLFSDGVHPTAAGSDSIAALFYRAYQAKATRVACIGNSITQYVGTIGGAQGPDSYPSQLNMLFGPSHYVRNFGVSGAYMQKKGSAPYWTNGRLAQVFAFKPSIITVMLGTNDARATQWNTNRFLTDYRAFVDTLNNTISPKPKIFLGLPMPSWKVNGAWQFDEGVAGNGINNDLIRDSVLPAIRQVAQEKGLATLDCNTPMQAWQSYVADGVHPNAKGQDTLAQTIFRILASPPTGIHRNEKRLPQPRSLSLGFEAGPGEAELRMKVGGGVFSVDGKSLPASGQDE